MWSFFRAGQVSLSRRLSIGRTHQGFPDEPAYHEDVDLCWRARQRGLTLRLVHAAGVRHHYEFSRNVRKMYLMERNRLLFVLTTYESSTLALLALPLIAFDLALLLVAWRQGWAREKARGWVWLARTSRTCVPDAGG